MSLLARAWRFSYSGVMSADGSPDIVSGDAIPSADLLPVVYEELRRLARGHMARESGPQTLTATALVHEAWLRVSGDETDRRIWQNRRDRKSVV